MAYLAAFSQMKFSNAFFDMKIFFIRISLTVVPVGAIDRRSQMVQVNGLAPNRRQAITWTNVDPVQWRMCAALGGGNCVRMGDGHWWWRRLAGHIFVSSCINQNNLAKIIRLFFYTWSQHPQLWEIKYFTRDKKKIPFLYSSGIDQSISLYMTSISVWSWPSREI